MKRSSSSTQTPTLPASCGNIAANTLSCLMFIYLIWRLKVGGRTVEMLDVAWVMVAAMLPMVIADLVQRGREGAFRPRHAFDLKRVLLKLTGLYAAFALMLGIYWLFPEYRGSFYHPFQELLRMVLMMLVPLAIPYVAWLDRRMESPEDGSFHLGLILTGKWAKADRRMVQEYLKCWVVKAFFLPLMASYATQNIQNMKPFDFSFVGFILQQNSQDFLYTLDLLFACTGYVMTFRLLKTQIYSAEPTTLGWVSCLMCYAPIWATLFYPMYFNYDDNYAWGQLVQGNENLHALWGLAIMLCTMVYVWATVAFGYRFSNLTYRGVITSGPYRYTKHPAYVFKSLSWWLISVPFISTEGWDEALRHSLLLVGVCLIYYVRARTEENHLSNYPEYIAYAEWINEHGMFRHLGRKIPYLRYSRERALRSGSKIYVPAT